MDLEEIKATPLDRVIRITSGALPAQDRLAIWREVYCARLFNMDIAPLDQDAFHAELAIHRLGEASLTSGVRSATVTRIEQRHLHNPSEMIMLISVLSGRAETNQRGKTVAIGPGEAVALRTDDPAEMRLSGNTRYIGLYVPQAAVAAGVADWELRLGRTLPRANEALQLLRAYARVIQESEPPKSEELRASVAAHFRDLVVHVLRDSSDITSADPVREPRMAAARLAAFQATIAANLGSPNLSALSVALSHRVSADYVRKVFRDFGLSFTDYVLNERLARIRIRLLDPECAFQSISSIALSCGFDDVSYFNRCFKRRYGCTPSDLRSGAR